MIQRHRSNNRKTLAQNFLKNPSYVRYLISLSNLTEQDRVLEIGAGNGIITLELANVAQQVTTLEVDPALAQRMRTKTETLDNVTVKQADILRYQLPNKPYKVFANIPFNITAEIVDKLLGSPFAPSDAFLLMQKETAEKFLAHNDSTEASALWQPWYDFKFMVEIGRTQFHPVPSVDAALLRITKRPKPHLPLEARSEYTQFVSHGFRAWRKDLKTAYKALFTYPQWKRLAKDARFGLSVKPSDLKLAQWLHLFNYYQTGVATEKKRQLFG
ncbi:MAG: 23S ribosomal RNA methyltransferase Erm [Candidatus Promineifilaceae bacterium]